MKFQYLVSQLLSILAFNSFVNKGLSKENIWIPNTNFDNPQNWNEGRIPCHADRVVFPRDSELSVFIQENITVKEIYLPNNGELILPSRGEMNIGVVSRQQCEGKDIRFVGTEVRHWFDPANWKVRDSWGNLNSDPSNDPVPHAEKIPCQYDDAIFAPNSTFKVRLEGFESTIRTLSINGKIMSGSSLRSFLQSRSGRMQFQVDTSVVLSNRKCIDPSGCGCGNDASRMLNHICGHVASGKCPVLHCTDPIKPAGSCCPLCGGLMNFKLGSGFQLDKLKSYIGVFLEKSFYDAVSAYTFKTQTGYIQAVFVDGALHRSASLVQILTQQLASDAQKSQLGIISTEFQYSEKWFDGPSPLTGYGGMSSGGITALVIGLLSALIIASLFYLQRHRLIPLAFSFGRFENEDDRYASHGALEMAVEMTQTVDPNTGKQSATAYIKTPDMSSAKGFDNPFYDPTCTDSDFNASAIMAATYKSMDTRENPCYMAFERVEDMNPPSSTEAGGTQVADSSANK